MTTLPAELRHHEIAEEQDFNSVGEYQAFQAAELWVEQNHYKRGPMDHGSGIIGLASQFSASMRFVLYLHNMTTEQRASLDGLMTGDFRNGPVRVTIFKSVN